jgi:Niemann-Pick C2 protein
MKHIVFITTIWALLLPTIFSVHIEDCGSKVGSFTNITISSCNETDPVCVLKKDSNATLDIYFTTSVADNSVKAEVHGIIQGVPVPFPLHDPDACHLSGLTCPLKPGNNYHYTATLPVLKSYPKIHLEVRWELKNENDDDIVCAQFPAKIV